MFVVERTCCGWLTCASDFFLDKPTSRKIFFTHSLELCAHLGFYIRDLSSRGTAYRFSFFNKTELPNSYCLSLCQEVYFCQYFSRMFLDWQSDWPELRNYFADIVSSRVENGG